MDYIQRAARHQTVLFPATLDEYVRPASDRWFRCIFFYQAGYLKSAKLSTGELNWSTMVASNGSAGSFRNLLSVEENIYLDRGFFFRAYNKETGHLVWNTNYTNDGHEFSGLGGPRISQDEKSLYLPRRTTVLKVSKSSGSITMEFILDRLIPESLHQSATDPIPYGNMLYVPTVYYDTINAPVMVKGNIFAFSRTTGELVWERKGPNKVQPTDEFETTDSLLIESSIYDIDVFGDYLVAGVGPSVMLTNRFTGEIIWHVPIKDRRFLGSPGHENTFGAIDVGLTVDESGIYLVTLDGPARKLDWETGGEIWSVNILYSNTSIPTVINGKLYFNNSGGGGIWVIDTTDGRVLFNSRPPANNGSYISSLGVGSGYMVNIGT
ncbi:MAG TPA: PQQ-binding-like beta-propeller repeat protein [Gracilimonas sp.]|uniref:outer membrane protein assembly factor BamB family protein n=1 Tax=Gracilimonas sp. TaxID=1974203 RepID=UPI002D89BC53|nr:PQQ-binding-like beta-propeller repeat protein [Gracilimonas sp.]